MMILPTGLTSTPKSELALIPRKIIVMITKQQVSILKVGALWQHCDLILHTGDAFFSLKLKPNTICIQVTSERCFLLWCWREPVETLNLPSLQWVELHFLPQWSFLCFWQPFTLLLKADSSDFSLVVTEHEVFDSCPCHYFFFFMLFCVCVLLSNRIFGKCMPDLSAEEGGNAGFPISCLAKLLLKSLREEHLVWREGTSLLIIHVRSQGI